MTFDLNDTYTCIHFKYMHILCSNHSHFDGKRLSKVKISPRLVYPLIVGGALKKKEKKRKRKALDKLQCDFLNQMNRKKGGQLT